MIAEQHVHLEAEESVIGGILLTDVSLEPLLVEVGLRPEHFHSARLRLIFAAMVELHDAEKPIDQLTLAEQLGDKLKVVGGRLALDVLSGAAPIAGNVREYARIVLDRALWRNRDKAVNALRDAVARRDEDAFGVAEAAISATDRGDASTSTAAELAEELFEYLGQTGEPDCIPTPFPGINRLIGGLFPGETTLLGSWNNFGKTIILHQTLENARDEDDRIRAHIYANDMSRRAYTMRAVSAYTGIDLVRLRTRQLTDDERRRAMRALERFTRLDIGITAVAGWSALDIARHLRRHRWDLWALDHLHRIPYETTTDLQVISNTLTTAAAQSNSHGLIAVQLNQARNDGAIPPRPVRRDVKGAGAITDDAANVLMLYRQMVELTVGGVGTGAFEPSLDGELYLEKVRNGEYGGVPIRLDPRRVRFHETAGGRLLP